MKKCNRCDTEKPLTEFRKASKESDGHQYSCRLCTQKMTRLSRAKHYEAEKERAWERRHSTPEKLSAHNARSKSWRTHNPDKEKDIHLKKKYGITLITYREMLDIQEGKCAICQQHQSEKSRDLSVDHDHATGIVRGLLCGNCNFAIGYLGDNPDNCIRAAAYLAFHKEKV